MRIGLIGGSGFEKNGSQKGIIWTTQWGHSSPIVVDKENPMGIDLVFCSRHGMEHTLPPTQVNYRANIQVLKDLKCDVILATTACGSLREEFKRGSIVIPDQFIDFTKNRKNTYVDYFHPNQMVHPPMGVPFNQGLRNHLIKECINMNCLEGYDFMARGTVVSIEGPRFSTRAESNMYRILGGDVINMTTATECSLAFEMGIPYAAICLVTDYDSWKEEEEPVTHEDVMKVFGENVSKIKDLLTNVMKKLS